jgi:hypothetical protein
MLKKLWIYFSKYSTILNGELKGSSVLNYLSSHDDPFDGLRTQGIEAGTKLLLSPGVAQIFYGDSLTGFWRELKAMLNYARLWIGMQ